MSSHRITSGLLSGALVLAACGGPPADAETAPTVAGVTTVAAESSSTISTPPAPPISTTTTTASTTSAPTSTTTASSTSTVALPPAAPYEPAATDVATDRKRIGGRFAQAVTTYDAGVTADQQAATLADRFGIDVTDAFVALVAEAMEPDHSAVGTVRYAQLGGSRATSASIMVWIDQERLAPDGIRSTESRVFDVRLERRGDHWVIASLESAGGPEVPRPADLTELAASVVDHPAISMPDSARWDIYSGHTTDAMLERMLEIARSHDYSVLVLHRGHPYHVFATDKVSRHSVGEAMDVYAVDGLLVVDARYEGSPAWTLSRGLYDAGIGSIGSPWAFDGFRGRSFTDDVHQDHLHITSL